MSGKKKICVAVDTWKLQIFEKHFRKNGFTWKEAPGLSIGTLHLFVHTTRVKELERVTRKANTECAKKHKRGTLGHTLH